MSSYADRLRYSAILIAMWLTVFAPLIAAQTVPSNIQSAWPSHNRPWSDDEYQDFYQKIATGNIFELPRLAGLETAQTFKRLVNPENFYFTSDKALPIGQRLSKASKSFETLNQVLKLYIAAYAKNTQYSTELIRIQGFAILVMEKQLALLDELIPKLDVNDPTYAIRILGVAQTRLGAIQMVVGAITSLGERDTYSAEDRLHLSKLTVESFPALTKTTDPDVRNALNIHIRRTMDTEIHSEIKALLAKLQTTNTQLILNQQ